MSPDLFTNEKCYRYHSKMSRLSHTLSFGFVLLAHAGVLFALQHSSAVDKTPPPQPQLLQLVDATVQAPTPQPPAPEPAKPEPRKEKPAPKKEVKQTTLPTPKKPIARPQVPSNAIAQANTPDTSSSEQSEQTEHGKEGKASPNAAPEKETAPNFAAAYLSNPKPAYPALSLELNEEGTVQLKVEVSAGGNPTTVALHRSSGFPRLDRAALEAVKRWRFIPAKRGDTAIAGSVIVPLNFNIKQQG